MQQNNFMNRKNLRGTNREVKEKKNDFFKYGGILLAGIVGLLIPAYYLFGRRFYEGVLSAYGVEFNSIGLDSTDVYEYGYYAIAHVAYDYLKSFKTIIFTVFLLIIFVIVLYFIIKVLMSKENFINFLHKFSSGKPINNELDKKIQFLYYLIWGTISAFAIFGILWITIPQWAYDKGQYLQSQNIREYHVYGCYYKEDSWNNCIQVLDENGTKKYEGLLIAVKGDKLALYQKDGSRVFRIKSNEKLYKSKKSFETNTTK